MPLNLSKPEQVKYGKIVGHLINLGFDSKIAREKTDKAITDMRSSMGQKKKKKATAA
jgi:hypothetical protein